MIRVALVAQPLALRAGIQAMLESSSEVEVIAAASTMEGVLPSLEAAEALILAAPLAPLEEAQSALEAYPSLPLLLLLGEESPPDVAYLGSLSHAWGVLSLEATGDELLAALSAVQHGLVVIASPLAQALFSSHALGIHFPRPSLDGAALEPLTEREMQVLQLLARGLANKQIAAALGISEHTVKFHVSAIYAKLGATNRAEAVRLGLQRGLVTL